VKHALGESYRYIEKRVSAVIAERFELFAEVPALVKKADDICLAIERRDLFPNSHQQVWAAGGGPLPKDLRIAFIDWRDAERSFLRRFKELFGGAHVA
jgi:hypothetical protein